MKLLVKLDIMCLVCCLPSPASGSPSSKLLITPIALGSNINEELCFGVADGLLSPNTPLNILFHHAISNIYGLERDIKVIIAFSRIDMPEKYLT